MGASATALSARRDYLSGVGTILLCTLIVLMIVPEGFDYRLLELGQSPDAGSALSRALWLGLFAGAALLAVWRSSVFLMTVRSANPFLFLFMAFAIASIAWSLEPIVTLRRDFRLATIVLVCFAFVTTGWHARRLQAVVRPILTLMLAGSIVFGLLAPTLAIHQETSHELIGAWRGLTNHKNSLGALAGVTLVLWLQAWSAREVRAWHALPCCLLAAACVWLSRSATSLIATTFAIAFLGLLTQWPRALQPYLKYAVAFTMLSLTVYTLTMLRLIPGQGILLEPLTALTGFDMTFTGRSEIWMLITEQIHSHPLLGVGYGAYWTGPKPSSPSYEFIVRMNGFYPGSAHNGYLEVANDLGWTGLLILLGYLAQQVRETLKLFIVNKPQAALYLTLFMHQAIANLSESHWMSVLSVHFVLMTLITAALARHVLELKMQLRQFRSGHSPAADPRTRPVTQAPAWQLHGRRA